MGDDRTDETPPQKTEVQEVFFTKTVNTNLDAPSIFVDAIQGAMLSQGVTKLCFLEQYVPYGETELRGRYVLNLVLPSDQLRPIALAMLGLADGLDSKRG